MSRYWKPAPWAPTHEGHRREFLYVDHRYWGEIEQFEPSGPCYANTIRGRIGAMTDVDAARAAVERTVLQVVRGAAE